ncbi:hypothetical protein AB1Y20_005954 [Prymnesium parvum]|uniref:Uncharacterized protein n=1 Tax=Prymnesium parvum TaxID=97485 RepID=A0AB34J196_PRYPA|mmetsp:Transcript_10542/g.26194  ORF Transcript_10542/g.26194 Transcript_10542/m.26194 type:complete len:91 (-) Transcript_10542:368-640(-)
MLGQAARMVAQTRAGTSEEPKSAMPEGRRKEHLGVVVWQLVEEMALMEGAACVQVMVYWMRERNYAAPAGSGMLRAAVLCPPAQPAAVAH